MHEGKELKMIHELMSPKALLLILPFCLLPNTGCYNGCDSLLEDRDTVTVINVHDATQNFVLHCACPFQQERDFGPLIGGGWAGSKSQKTMGKLLGLLKVL